jgi:hypothetical protein
MPPGLGPSPSLNGRECRSVIGTLDQSKAEAGYVVRGDNPWLILAVIAVIVLACVLASCRPRPTQRRRDRSFARSRRYLR